MDWAIWVIGLAALGVAGYFYVGVITSHTAVASAAMDKSTLVANATGFFGTLDAKLLNWKTIILGWIAGVTATFQYLTQDAITGWQSLPWAQVFDAKIAGWITIACGVLIPIVHAQGVAKAAVTPPVDPGA